jgi:hypothetical protein
MSYVCRHFSPNVQQRPVESFCVLEGDCPEELHTGIKESDIGHQMITLIRGDGPGDKISPQISTNGYCDIFSALWALCEKTSYRPGC